MRIPSRVAVAAVAVVALSSADARAQVKAGPEFRANTYTTGVQLISLVAESSGGEKVKGDVSGRSVKLTHYRPFALTSPSPPASVLRTPLPITLRR